MSSLTELQVFKQCVQHPRRLDRSMRELNLDNIKDHPTDQGNLLANVNNQQSTDRKAQKLFYMVWSGLTKYIHQMVQTHSRPVMLPDFCVLAPINDTHNLRDPLSKGALEQLERRNKGVALVHVHMSDDFLKLCDWKVAVDEQTERAVSRFNKQLISVKEQFPNLSMINLVSIAKVCSTDVASVENILREIVAQVAHIVCQGQNVRLNMKLGHLIIRNGLIQWYNQRDNDRIYGNDDTVSKRSVFTSASKFSVSPSMADCKQSVMTPALSMASRAISFDKRSFNMSNPNPQNRQKKFLGARDVNPGSINTQQDNFDLLRFGKKVVFGNQVSNDDVLQEHLRQMREKSNFSEFNKKQKLEQERIFLERIQKELDMDESKRITSTQALKNDFLTYNAQKIQENAEKKVHDDVEKKEPYSHFPFVSGDILDHHRRSLGNQLRSDLQNYMVHQRQNKKNNNTKNQDFEVEIDSLTEVSNSRSGRNQKTLVKSLFDSEYVAPDKNHKVFQDSHPNKSAVFKSALQRYEESIKSEKDNNAGLFKQHVTKVDLDQRQYQNEQDHKRLQKVNFKEQLQQQITENAERRDKDKMKEMQPVKTNWGPEESTIDVQAMIDRTKKQRQMVKESLMAQMQFKKENEQSHKMTDLTEGKANTVDNEQALSQQRQQLQKEKQEINEFWKDQLQQKQLLKLKENEAAKAIKGI